jgi:hypothetical protein
VEIITVATWMHWLTVETAVAFVNIATLFIRVEIIVAAEVATVAARFTFWTGYHLINSSCNGARVDDTASHHHISVVKYNPINHFPSTRIQ